MDDLFWNKIAGATLGTGLFVFALKLAGGALYHGEAPAKPGFLIATAEAQTAAGAKADAGPKVSLGTLLASADKANGEAKAKQCGACHEFTKGGGAKAGPVLWDIVGRGIGKVDGFPYSEQLKAMSGKTWDYAALDNWINNPKEMAPNTKMSFGGVHDAKTRADILAYLGSLSDSPKPFPAP